MTKIKFDILFQHSARDTVGSIAAKYDYTVAFDQWDIQCTQADHAALTDKWQLEETFFVCIRVGDSPWYLHLSRKDMAQYICKENELIVDVAIVPYSNIECLDYDSKAYQSKFRNYKDTDIKQVLVGWAKSIGEGGQCQSIPVTLVDVVPNNRISQIKLPFEKNNEAENANIQ